MNSSHTNRIHPLADVKSTRIGSNTNVWQFSVILQNAVIGNDCNICSNVFIENEVYIGHNVTIKNGVQIWDGISIENNVFIGPNVTFTNDLYPRSKDYSKELIKTNIDAFASIGANATILCGNRIGKHSLIGAGTLVNQNIPANTIWVGNPCRQIGFISNSGKRIKLEEVHKIDNLNELLND